MHLEQLKQNLQQSQRIVEFQLQTCNSITGGGADDAGTNSATLREEELSQDHDTIMDAMRKKTQALVS